MGHNFFFRITSNLPKKSYPTKTTLLKRFQKKENMTEAQMEMFYKQMETRKLE